MASRFHKSRQRRAEREPLVASGNLNLIPLVDILTSIVFFSLLTYTGAVMAQLTTFDLKLPPVMVTGQSPTARAEDQNPDLTLAVRVTTSGFQVEHNEGAFKQAIAGLGPASLDSLQSVLTQIKQQYPTNDKVSVVPNDDVQYDDIVHVLERVKQAKLSAISLGSAVRAQQVALNMGKP